VKFLRRHGYNNYELRITNNKKGLNCDWVI
jgi:hypothetical protein